MIRTFLTMFNPQGLNIQEDTKIHFMNLEKKLGLENFNYKFSFIFIDQYIDQLAKICVWMIELFSSLILLSQPVLESNIIFFVRPRAHL